MIKKCLFPAAGYGTRFLPATKSIPKEMLPLVTKPLIQYGVEEAINAGCDTIAMVVSKYKKSIEDHFDNNTDIQSSINGTSKENLLNPLNNIIENTTFSYTRQLEMKGLGHAILTGQTLIGDESFAVILADDVCHSQNDSVLSQMMSIHEKYPQHCIVAIEEIPLKNTNKYGVISGEEIENNLFRVDNMIEKPEPKDAPSNLAIIGRYILTPDIFEVIKNTSPSKGGEIQITDALLTLAKKGKVLAYKFDGKRFDCGSIDGFIEATNYFYEREARDEI
ncbi:MAG TPA: UTP--glucose-1-phosphate uridylyltransferase GalU [Arcobacter sp.]|nr:UTP--glucose-1-phosphate uridylyltransferase GalU [Arcobacter sp.]HIP56423.1 UTP--glucose-1-phosphate uridylyltransferase GalU [Arcobacter sp.]